MTSLPVPVAPASVPQDSERLTAAHALHDALAAAHDYALASKAANTVRAYRSAYTDFCRWCETVEQDPLPASPGTLAAYLAHLAEQGKKAGTIRHRLAAIGQAHKAAGYAAPTADIRVQAVHKGIRRRLGTRPTQKAPATASVVAKLIKKIPADTLAGKRDRALLTLGFAAALRRSELVALDVGDLETAAGGLLLRVNKSKTDQEGRGQTVPVPDGKKLMPVESLRAWLSAANLTAGPLFVRIGKGDRVTTERLTAQSVALIVKKYAKAAKLDAASFSGHSLRAGLVTEALSNGADVFAVADQGRWRKLETVREYDRRAKALKGHFASKFL